MKHTWNWSLVQPVIDNSVMGLCVKAYPNHPKGCPNHNKKAGCPPSAPMFFDRFDAAHAVYAIWNKFDFGAHVAKMRKAHPDWSRRQVECCLYWQGTARKQLKMGVKMFHAFLPAHQRGKLTVTGCPEAMGVNVTETMRVIGIELEWPPVNYTYQVALVGLAKDSTEREGS